MNTEKTSFTSDTSMLFITTAMQPEARPLIAALGLKQNHSIARFRVYDSPGCSLIISGTGKLRSAVATTFLLTLYNASPDDFWINAGVCGSVQEDISTGSIFLINRIRDHETGREMFPDILYRHDFQEDALETFSAPVHAGEQTDLNTRLVDMEASGAFEAARMFLPLHRLAVIKVVLDYLKPHESKRMDVEKAMSASAGEIARWLHSIPCQRPTNWHSECTPNPICTLWQHSLARMDLSKSMEVDFKHMINYLGHADPEGKSQAAHILYAVMEKPDKIRRREAKKIIAALREELIKLPLPA